MDRAPADIDLEDIEREIESRPGLLRFSSKIERQFETDTDDSRRRQMIWLNYLGLLSYHCFLFSDYQAIRDAFKIDVFMHLCIMTPVVIGLNVMLSRRRPAWVRESIETAGIIILTMTIVAVVSQSRAPDRDMVLLCLTLVVLFAILTQRIRFRYALVCSLAIQASYTIGLTTIDAMSLQRTVMSNSVVACVIFYSLLGGYNLEVEERKSYLLSLRNTLRNRDLEIESLNDALTGVGNRRALDTRLQRLVDLRHAGPTSVLLLDIDHFKSFNDTNGHQKGDTCLKLVASLVAASLQGDEGVVYRFGGEEFLILLDDSELAEAVTVAERIRANIARAQIPRDHSGKTFITVSVGVASGYVNSRALSDALIASADAALYRAKHNGRNQISPNFDRASDPTGIDDRWVA